MMNAGVLLLMLMAWSACSPAPESIYRDMVVINAPVRVHAQYEADEDLRAATSALRGHGARLLALIDIYNATSEIARANQIGHRSRFPISRDTRRILLYAQRLSANTDGAWDLTDAALRHVWARHFDSNPSEPLPAPLVRASRRGIGHELLNVDEHALLLLNESTQLDLNEFAQPYVVDLAVVQLRREGRRNFWFEAASFGRTLGRMSTDQNWALPIYHPLKPDTRLGQLLLTEASAYALSGWSEDWGMVGDQRTSRIIDPRTGWPSTGDAAVLVVGPVATDAFVFSRALHVMAQDEASRLLAEHSRYAVMYVTYADVPEIKLSPSLQSLFQPEPEFAEQVRILAQLEPIAAEQSVDAEQQESDLVEP